MPALLLQDEPTRATSYAGARRATTPTIDPVYAVKWVVVSGLIAAVICAGRYGLQGHPSSAAPTAPLVHGCEPRVDYSKCSSGYVSFLPYFYGVLLVLQCIPCAWALHLLFDYLVREWRAARATVPFAAPAFCARVRHLAFLLSRQTVLQLKFGVVLFTCMAILHHSALLSGDFVSCPLIVEYCYNLYNAFLVGTLLGCLRYWREYILICTNLFTDLKVSRKPVVTLWIDRVLVNFVFTWQGALAYSGFSCAFCIATDSWGMLSRDESSWFLAVRLQHLQFGIVCMSIAVGTS